MASLIGRTMPRVERVALVILRDGFPPGSVDVDTWTKNVTYREYPIVHVRRLGGSSGPDPDRLDIAVVEFTAYHKAGPVDASDLYYDVRALVFRAWKAQTVTPVGYFHSYQEVMGPTQLDSPYGDTWRVQGLIQLGVRPPNT